MRKAEHSKTLIKVSKVLNLLFEVGGGGVRRCRAVLC